jgi:hypothetical protein
LLIVFLKGTKNGEAVFVLSVHPSSYGFSHNEKRQLKVFRLTPDWKNITLEGYRNITAPFPLPNKYDGKLEAPSPFYFQQPTEPALGRGDSITTISAAAQYRYFVLASHCTYWFPNDAVLLGSPELLGSSPSPTGSWE